jgi:pyruvate formate lyase activating enzyme
LNDAHHHPEKYPNLTIRVSGYAVLFNRLTPEQREEFMARTMHSSSKAAAGCNNCILHGIVAPTAQVTTAGKKREYHTERLVETNEKEEKDGDVLGSVSSLETFSTADGPAIRMTFFLQGCPKRCLYCCNPETRDIVDPKKHPEFAMSSGEVVSLVGKYQEWLRPRGGGITLSGGEPMLQPRFVSDVFKGVHTLGLTTCLDTACHGNKEIWNEVLPYTDVVLLCLKGMDNKLASKIAQVPVSEMAKSKEFARFIRDNYPNIQLILRWVLLEDFTDTDAEIDALIAFAQELAPVFASVELIPFHELGKEKYASLNQPYPLEGMPPYCLEAATRVKERLEKHGISTVLSNVDNLCPRHDILEL